jgi:hypothetical protein
VQISVTADVSRLKLDLARERARLARAGRRMVNAAAFEARAAIMAEMDRVFDRPTPWIRRSVLVVPARDGDVLREPVEARIEWREGGNKSGGTPGRVLRAQIEGGPRAQKGFERLLRLPPDRIAVPGRWAPLDAYGNLPGPFLVRVLSDLRLFGEVGYLANRSLRNSPRRRRAARFFMVRVGSEDKRLWPGVYDSQGPGGAPLLVIAFVRRAQYRARFAPARVAAASITRSLPSLWEQALRGTLPFRSTR